MTIFRAEGDNQEFNPLRLQSFAQQANVAVSMAFIGLGQGGGKMTDAFAAIKDRDGTPYYNCMAINSYVGDLKALKHVPDSNRISLFGWENGCGGDPFQGYAAVTDERNCERIGEKILEVTKDARVIWVLASYGGGTGTGSHGEIINWAASTGKPVGAIISLPRRGNLEELGNAFDAIANLVNNQLGPEADRPLKALIIIDNEKVYQDYMEDKKAGLVCNMDWMQYANHKVAHVLHELNVITTGASDVNFDPKDFIKVLFSGGIVTFAKRRVRIMPEFTEQDLVKEVVDTVKGKNVLANGFDYEGGTMAGAFSLVTPMQSRIVNIDSLEMISDELKARFPGLRACHHKGYVPWTSEKYGLIYTVMALNSLPVRATGLKDEYTRAKAEQDAISARRPKIKIDHAGGATVPRHASPFSGANESTVTNPFAAKSKISSSPFGQNNAVKVHPWSKK